jgi:large subunit ribosomal protein L7/L12
MGLFGSAQEQVDLDDVKARIAKLESAVASLQSQVVALSAGAPGAPGAPVTAVDGIPYGTPQPSLGALPADGGPWLAEVRALAASDQKIQAIKLYRERTGVGLKEAKDAVEGMG